MLSRKSIDLLYFLHQEKRKLSLKELSDTFSISERSIRYEIEKIQKELAGKYGFECILSKGECFIDNDKALEEYLYQEQQDYTISPKEREIYILLKIFFEREINQNTLAEFLDSSRSTVKLHLKNIKKTLEESHLELELLHKKGLGIQGEEDKIRQATLRAMTLVKKSNSSFLKSILDQYLEGIDKEGVKLFINYCQKLMNKIISDEAFDIISKYLILSIYFYKTNSSVIPRLKYFKWKTVKELSGLSSKFFIIQM